MPYSSLNNISIRVRIFFDRASRPAAGHYYSGDRILTAAALTARTATAPRASEPTTANSLF